MGQLCGSSQQNSLQNEKYVEKSINEPTSDAKDEQIDEQSIVTTGHNSTDVDKAVSLAVPTDNMKTNTPTEEQTVALRYSHHDHYNVKPVLETYYGRTSTAETANLCIKVGKRNNNLIPITLQEKLSNETRTLKKDMTSYNHTRYTDSYSGRQTFDKNIKYKHNIECLIDPYLIDIKDSPFEGSLIDSNSNSIDANVIREQSLMIPATYNTMSHQFTSRINNCSFLNYSQSLYQTIEDIYGYMLPMFNYFINDNNNNIAEIELIVSLKEYLIEMETEMESVWVSMYDNYKRTGIKEENIIAVGMYVYDMNIAIDNGVIREKNSDISGGINVNLDIKVEYDNMDRNDHDHDNKYRSQDEYTHLLQLSNIINGTCIVIGNSDMISHKLNCSLNSKSRDININDRISFKMLSYFLIDPTNHIASSKDRSVNWDDISVYAVNRWYKQYCEKLFSFPNDLINVVVKYVVGESIQYRYNLRDERRNKAKQDALNAKNGLTLIDQVMYLQRQLDEMHTKQQAYVISYN